MDTLTLRVAHAQDSDVADLVRTHFALMRASSPEESCHVMPADALAANGALVLAADFHGRLAGIGALAEIDATHGEIKSMHTAKDQRGKGVGRFILTGLIDSAKDKGFRRLSLETGSAELFAPARALYASFGFVKCAPFANYTCDPFSVFMSRNV